MTPVLVSVDKAGDLKIGRKKCRLYRKDEVVKVARKYGINTDKKTVGELCGAIKSRAKNSPMNNIPLAKLYPEAAKKRAEKKALNKKIAANFMKGMVTTNANIKKLRELNVKNTPPKPRGPNPTAVMRARANAKDVIRKGRVRKDPENLRKINRMSPRRVMKLARELRRLR
jgi:hypothetical protein